MDAWIGAAADTDDPNIICGSVQNYLAPDMILTVTGVTATDPLDWTLSLIHGYEVPSGLADVMPVGTDLPFRHLPDRKFTLGTLVAGRQRTIAQARPEIDSVDACLCNVRMFGDRIILPSRNTGRHGSWCVSLVRIRCLLPMTDATHEPDVAELAILQLLREGYSARSIGGRLGLSPRTVEHKLEKLKAAFGARSVAHLATLSIVSAIGPR
ncbi:DNA-binding CsgD family transcriptional regulator [Agrobacterium tumefaciens]|uniref:DNA-binding CsgD family transcriptional regulator n=1 Tax=Agrobacterium radiobacter TaxID=362 RepID=A0ABR6J6N8_AGRRD|nr:helix-turn-helix transcriptional regulator [Agrobacterium radiobacter]TGE76517.1 hypothetical protein C9410_23085 [Rhizobium sp. SEMIA 439]MBB4283883.1 DNA-binding CsgD family transcriptional regulator [Agrobacterium radiobacter]MBB4319621.1 DNA-binding CsgD family transcriptional regulator [Agrobacterium radiobacter]MBB4326008.1 DNA-binding CsgD family transcriptional regulator [Agrobacterium radiobacter]MBB4337847.1 DNA-binding CsgD family transcriptional regulator [Agrobacterium radiobac